jgi:mono/diheme cytochrome c family protein
MNIITKILLIFTLSVSLAFAAEPALFIKSGGREINFTRSELVKRKDFTTITTKDDPTFPGKTIVYKAVPAADLFNGITIPDDATIQFQTLDHFSAPINKHELLNTSLSAAIPYIAIEMPGEKWPALKPGIDDRTSAPFYLIWKNPEKSRISSELWVMQLIGFTIEEPFAKLYPHVAPAAEANDAVKHGFQIFKTNCFACHTINREGNAKIAPDLNVPHNPTEYFQAEYLRKFIRNPQDLRYWPHDKMMGFPKSAISDEELDHLIAYLKYMRDHKV